MPPLPQAVSSMTPVDTQGVVRCTVSEYMAHMARTETHTQCVSHTESGFLSYITSCTISTIMPKKPNGVADGFFQSQTDTLTFSLAISAIK